MKIRSLCLMFLSFLSVLSAATFIDSNTVSGEWTQSDSPYYIMNDVSIPEGQNLSIMPGVRVITNGLYSINVYGTLRAIGSPADSIYFTAADTTIGWHGLHFNQVGSEPDSSYVKYCHISYGKTLSSGDSNFGYKEGGGIFLRYRNKVVISYSTITKCQANGGGGGIYTYYSNLNLHNSLVTNNKASSGGGIFVAGITNTKISDSVIANNIALISSGGGLQLVGTTTSSAFISNSLICNNSSVQNGAGIFNTAIPTYIKNCTIANNLCFNPSNNVFGYGAFFTLTSLTHRKSFVNCLIANNSNVGNVTQGVATNADFLYCNIVNGNVGGTGTTQSNTINNDPLFISPPAGMGANYNGVSANFGLSYNSPCIDTGDPTQFDADGTRSDIGYRPYLHKAWFLASPLFLTVGDVVNLQNLSQGYDIQPAITEWDINADGTFESNSYNWSYQFNSPGVYPIKLIQSVGVLRDSCYQSVVVQQNQLPAPENVRVNVIDSEVVLSWNPINETVDHDHVDVHYYVVYSCDKPEGIFSYLGVSDYNSTQFTHSNSSTLTRCFYIVIGFDGDDRELCEFINSKPEIRAVHLPTP